MLLQFQLLFPCALSLLYYIVDINLSEFEGIGKPTNVRRLTMCLYIPINYNRIFN